MASEAPAWMPGVFTRPLSEDFPSAGDKLLQVIDVAWKSPEQEDFSLDEWQRWLIRHVLEVYPKGHPKAGELRYRQVVISMGRQNGKSVLGAIFGLYALLLHMRGPEVFSVASTVEQANIIYKRVKHVIDNNRTLTRRLKTSGTRGITSKLTAKPASYFVKAGKEESLQGYPLSACLADELHLWKPETWAAILLGSSARRGLIIGITTAGDENSALLKMLYEQGRAAASGDEDGDERFGFFLWEAPEHLSVRDPQFYVTGNPAIACGRLPLEQEMAAAKLMPEAQVRRYRGNQFISSESAWLPMDLWNGAGKGNVPTDADLVFAVDRAENWSYATVTAAAKVDGKVHTEVVASLVNPTLDSLEDLCVELDQQYRPMKTFMESSNLMDLAKRLRERGVEVEYLTTTQMQNVSATAYALIADGRVVHADDPVVNVQMPRAVAKNVGEGWRISRRDSATDVDAVLATVMGIYGAETERPRGPMLAVFDAQEGE